jgi:hypothetical protein
MATPTPTTTPTPPPPAQLQNIATRLRTQTGDNVSIGGFIVRGNAPKRIIIRGLGPSILTGGSATLADPTLELHDANSLLFFNNDWRDSQQAEIQATGLAPTNNRESAIVRTLVPGSYTAVLRGNNGGTGISLIEIYDLDLTADSKLANISTRGFVETADNVMIGGFIAGPSSRGNATIVVRGIGPSLADFGLQNTLQNPMLELHDGNGATIVINDDWLLDPNAGLLLASGYAPSDTRESAIYRILAPGAYTAILRGVNNTTGVALVEVYNLP